MVPSPQFSKLELMQGRVEFIPEGWEFLHLQKAFNIRNQLRLPISETERNKNPGRYPYYGPTKIQGYIGSYEQDGDFALIGEDGDHFLKFKNMPMTQLVEGKCTVNNHAHIIEGTDKATREWFYYYFMHRDIFSFLTRQGASRYKLNKAALEKLPVLVPPLPEQTKVSKILSIWDSVINTTELLIANSQKQKKALMQQLLTGKKRLGGGAKGDFIRLHLSDVAEIDLKNLKKKSERNFEFKYISLSDVSSGKIKKELRTFNFDNAPSRAKRKVTDGDILMATVRPNLQGFARVTSDYVNCIASTGFSVLTPKSNIYGDYLYHYLFGAHVMGQINSLVVGSSYPAINSSDVAGLAIYCPKYEEQKKIARILNSCDDSVSLSRRKLKFLKQEKKALMQQLLTGKRRVKLDD